MRATIKIKLSGAGVQKVAEGLPVVRAVRDIVEVVLPLYDPRVQDLFEREPTGSYEPGSWYIPWHEIRREYDATEIAKCEWFHVNPFRVFPEPVV
jgi:hypothetical protein